MYKKTFQVTDPSTNIPNLIEVRSFYKSNGTTQLTKVIEKAFPQDIQVISIVPVSDCWWVIITTEPRQTKSKAIKVEHLETTGKGLF